MQSLIDWLVSLPPGALYAILSLTAALENFFPPFPSDVVIAFGAFVAAQGNATIVAVFAFTWFGNVAGALVVYALGRRYGAERLERRLAGKKAESRDARIRSMFDRWGMPAVFVSRFVPGVRAIVPAFAGALRLPVLTTTVMIGTASAIWYGLITLLAFRVGADWERLNAIVARYSTFIGIAASVVFAVGVGAWLLTRRSRPPK